MLGEWKVPKKCFSKKNGGGYDEDDYDETDDQSSSSIEENYTLLAYMESSLNMTTLPTSSERALETSPLPLNLLCSLHSAPPLHPALSTSVKAATEEETAVLHLNYCSSDGDSDFSLLGATADEDSLVFDSASLEAPPILGLVKATAAPTPGSSVLFGSEFPMPAVPTPESSVLFGSEFPASAAPIPGSSVPFASGFSVTAAPAIRNKSLFGSEIPASVAPIPGSSVPFGSGFSVTAAPAIRKKSFFSSRFSATAAPASRKKSLFGSEFPASVAPIPGSSVPFGSELSVTAAAAIRKKSLFGSEFPATAVPTPESSVPFGSEFPMTAAPAVRNKSLFGSGSPVAASPAFGGHGVPVATVSPDRYSGILGSGLSMAEAPAVGGLVAFGFDSSVGPAVGSPWFSGPVALPDSCSITLDSIASMAAAPTIGESKSYGSRLHIPQAESIASFTPAPSSASQDQNMVHHQMPQSPPEDSCLITTDSFIFEESWRFKENGQKCKTSLNDSHALRCSSLQKLNKDPETVLSKQKIKRGTRKIGVAREKKLKEWPEKSLFLQKKKEDIEKVLRSKSCGIPWIKLFEHQNKKGYWNVTADLGVLLKINVEYLTNVFLIEKGIKSLGHQATEEIVSLIVTLMILQLIRFTEQLKGIKLKSLFKLEQTLDSRTPHWALESVKKAIGWARSTDRQYPAICSRLELGRDWESATRQLLQIDPLKKGSPLQQLFNQEE